MNYSYVTAGYVPRWPFKFGKSYREECDICLSEFMSGQKQQKLQQRDVQSMTRSQPSLRPVSGDTSLVLDRLNSFTADRKIHSSSGVDIQGE